MNSFVFMLFVLPIWLIKEGYKIFKKRFGHEDGWLKLAYFLLILFGFAAFVGVLVGIIF